MKIFLQKELIRLVLIRKLRSHNTSGMLNLWRTSVWVWVIRLGNHSDGSSRFFQKCGMWQARNLDFLNMEDR